MTSSTAAASAARCRSWTDRAQRLDALPGWVSDVSAEEWEAGYRRLLDYLAAHGTARAAGLP
jgi:hypothetical protein